jgi:phosphoglycolate phosphatase-like HAD superfamily hydrolase
MLRFNERRAPTAPTPASTFLTDPRPPTREDPWIIRYVLADLDGTRMSSYSAFHALELLTDWFYDRFKSDPNISNQDVVSDLAAYIHRHASIETLLHYPEETLHNVAKAYALDKAPHLVSQVLSARFLASIPGLLEACEESFRLFPGAEDFLILAHDTRTAFGIYTATCPQHAVDRMIRAGENPELVQEIWSRTGHDQELAGHFDWDNPTVAQLSFVNLLRPYKDSKPFVGPLRAVHEQYELLPDSILMIGEGSKDMGCVLEDPSHLDATSRLYARFAFQRQGAAMTERYATINDVLREDHPLGLTCFERRYPRAEDHPGVVVLDHGFETLLGMVASGHMVLEPTPPPFRDSDLAQHAYRRNATPRRRRLR